MAENKLIKNFKRRQTSTRRELHQFIKAMREANLGDKVEGILLEKGFAPCVAREWGNAHLMHAAIHAKAKARKIRKELSTFGAKGDDYRRIIFSKVRNSIPGFHGLFTTGRLWELHATKGWRDYQIAKA